MNRRRFIQTTAAAAASSALISCSTTQPTQGRRGQSGAFFEGVRAKKVRSDPALINWPIGCFNRPWAGDKKNWGYDAALDGIQAAGYKLTGLLTRTAKEPLIGSDASEDYLAG